MRTRRSAHWKVVKLKWLEFAAYLAGFDFGWMKVHQIEDRRWRDLAVIRRTKSMPLSNLADSTAIMGSPHEKSRTRLLSTRRFGCEDQGLVQPIVPPKHLGPNEESWGAEYPSRAGFVCLFA
jgi:hypothetical protein